MSQLPPQAIDEFQALWKKHYGDDLPRTEATIRAHQLLALLQIITEISPPPQEMKLPQDSIHEI